MNKLLILLVLAALSCTNSPEKVHSAPGDTSLPPDPAVKILSSPADSASAEPYLFTGRNGVVYLSWIEKKGNLNYLKFSTLQDEQWSKPGIIISGSNWFVNWADYPQLAAEGNKLLAHYLEKSDTGTFTYDVKLVSSADGGDNWSIPAILHDDGKKAEHGFVSMAPGSENYLVAWLDGRNAAMGGNGHGGAHHGEMTLRAALIDMKGKKSGEWELDSRVCDCCQTSAAITTAGPVVVYRDRSEKEIRDISIVRFVKGAWTRPQPVFSDAWEISGCPVNGPRVDALGNHLAVAWFSSPGNKSQVKVAFSTNAGADFHAPVRIDEGNGIGRVDVVMIDENSAVVSWMEGSSIRAVKVYLDGLKEPSKLIASSTTARSGGFPQMTRAGGRLVFAWTDDKEKTVRTAVMSL